MSGLCKNLTGNTGQSNCEELHKARGGSYLSFIFDADGNRNSINTATFNQAALVLAINHADPLKRIYPVGQIKNVTGERADGDTQAFDDKSENYFDNETRDVAYLINLGSPALLKNLKDLLCAGNQIGEYIVEKNGNLGGENYGTDNLLYPIEIYASSAKSKWQFPGQAIAQGINVAYKYDPSQKDEDIALFDITGTDLITLKAEGLLNVYSEISGISTTGATIKLYLEYGSVGAKIAVTGLVSADFVSSFTGLTAKIYNQTDALDVTVTATETATPGTYTLAWAAQTLTDVLVPFAKKNKYDFTPLKSNTLTIV